MSTPAAGGSGGPDEERKGLSKFVRRASKVFRRRSSTPASASGSSDLTQTAPGTGPIKSTAPQVSRYVHVTVLQRNLIDKSDSPPPIAEAAIEEQSSVPPPVPITSQQPIEQKSTPGNARIAKTAAASITIHEERARTLFVKYGLTLEPGEWTSPIKPDAERVEKKIRMRVHRQCHKCQTTFGSDRVCSKCDHNRCKKCPRYPGKRTKESKGKGIATTEEGPAAMADTELSLKNLTISSRTTGKQLPKKDKYPEGYPGDSDYNAALRERHDIRVHVRWTCHLCSKTFKDLSRKCEGCQHERCDECPRHPPKREKRKLDPDALARIEGRMKEGLSPQGASAA
ncbi:MAG: hypothetical protein LQ350_000394 [Teloschistes chrysophthalmus]|nr:MAG: hypothetical protein LQ350_000394 [Niorma chrysophthalma]